MKIKQNSIAICYIPESYKYQNCFRSIFPHLFSFCCRNGMENENRKRENHHRKWMKTIADLLGKTHIASESSQMMLKWIYTDGEYNSNNNTELRIHSLETKYIYIYVSRKGKVNSRIKAKNIPQDWFSFLSFFLVFLFSFFASFHLVFAFIF